MGGLLVRGGSFPLHLQYFFRGVCDGLTACSLNGWQNSVGFHGANMDAFLGGLYRRKLGLVLIVDFRAFPVLLNDNKRECKGGLPLQTNLFVFLSSLAIGS